MHSWHDMVCVFTLTVQIEFLAKKSDTLEKDARLKDNFERKFADLEAMCDNLRAENTVR